MDATGAAWSRRLPWAAVGLAVVLLLTAAGRLLGGRSSPAGPTAAAPPAAATLLPRAAPAGGGAPAESTEPSAAPAPRFEPMTCWRELDRFNDTVTLANFRSLAAALLASADDHVLAYLKERLTELIGADPGRATEVLGWVRDATPKEAGVFLSALRGSEAVQQPEVAARLRAMSFDPTLAAERRAGLLSALDTQKQFAPAVLGQLADLARDPSSGEAGWAATRTIGRVMATDFQRTGNVAPYLEKLLAIGSEAKDDDIRYLALSLPMHADPILDTRAIATYARILTTEGSANGRDAAAHMLSLSQDKARVLSIFAAAFKTDTDLCARWAMFRFAARAAGPDALPVMADMAADDPRFAADYQMFAQIYQSGVVDFERVWLLLPDQDPHDCLHRPD